MFCMYIFFFFFFDELTLIKKKYGLRSEQYGTNQSERIQLSQWLYGELPKEIAGSNAALDV